MFELVVDFKLTLSIPCIFPISSVSNVIDKSVPLISFVSDLQLYPPIEPTTKLLFNLQVTGISEIVFVSNTLKNLRVATFILLTKEYNSSKDTSSDSLSNAMKYWSAWSTISMFSIKLNEIFEFILCSNNALLTVS